MFFLNERSVFYVKGLKTFALNSAYKKLSEIPAFAGILANEVTEEEEIKEGLKLLSEILDIKVTKVQSILDQEDNNPNVHILMVVRKGVAVPYNKENFVSDLLSTDPIQGLIAQSDKDIILFI
jgi:hypothetical protein